MAGESTWENYSASVEVEPWTDDWKAGLIAYVQDNRNYYQIHSYANGIRMSKIVDDAPAPGYNKWKIVQIGKTEHTLGIKCVGNYIKFYYNGNYIDEFYDPDPYTSGKIGLRIWGNSKPAEVWFDNIEVNSQWGVGRTHVGVYETSAALWAFLAAKNYPGYDPANYIANYNQMYPSFDTIIKDAAVFLDRCQCIGLDIISGIGNYGVNFSDYQNLNHGGWGYPMEYNSDEARDASGNAVGWADLSNTQFAVLALKYADEAEDSLGNKLFTWESGRKKAAISFVKRCQKFSSTDNTIDGGFIYKPSDYKHYESWGGGHPYGSISAAGLWSLNCLGVNESHSEYGKVEKIKDWLIANYSYKENKYVLQGHGGTEMWYYYYLMTSARALTFYDWKMLNGIDWYKDFSKELTNCQNAEGWWEGKVRDDGEGEPKTLATVEALLTFSRSRNGG